MSSRAHSMLIHCAYHLLSILTMKFFVSAGIAPSVLWTVIVGATFGTVAARGVDGNKAIDSTVKAVVLGLGVFFCVLGLIGTAIYARRELTKIIMDEQNEMAMEDRADAELAQSFRFSECESISEEDGSCSFEDVDNLQLGNTSADPSDSQSASPPKMYRKIYRRPWTPNTVASELPILPKVLNLYLSPKRDQFDVRSDESSSSVARTNCKQNRSASMPDGFHSILDDSDTSASSPYSDSRRHTVDNLSPEIIRVGLVSTPKSSVPRSTSFSTEDTCIHGLANIDETEATGPKRYHKTNERHWAPDSVALELNEFISPKTSRSRDQNEMSTPRARANCKQNQSASVPSPDLLNNSDMSTSSTSSRSRKRTVENHSPQYIRATSRSPGPRSHSLQTDEDSIHGLANIDEANVFSGYETPTKSITNPAVFENEDGIRRRCHTDPTDSGGRRYASAPFSAGADNNPRPTVSPPPRNKHTSPACTPSKKGRLRTRHSTDSFGESQTPQQQSSPPEVQGSPPSRSVSMTFPQREEQPIQIRRRSSSFSFQLSPSTNNVKLNIRNRNGPQREEQPIHGRPRSESMPLPNHFELNVSHMRNDSRESNGTDEPSREWFWIWA